MFVRLSSLAKVSLGYKSLQNDFFYVNQETIASYRIEEKYLTPILMIRNMNSRSYLQNVSNSVWLFTCRDKEEDLRGTGAHRYIQTMADRLAAEKKQTDKKSLTIKQVLEAQGGGTWYAPKARPSLHHLWVRKAFDGIFSPYIFDQPTLVDQRCNSLSPLGSIKWEELASVLTTSLFAYSLEINGSANLGAGALEAATTKLRDFPVLDITKLSIDERETLRQLTEASWQETPPDWSGEQISPGDALRALDQWVLSKIGSGINVNELYADIHSTCRSRILIAADKEKKVKKKTVDNVGSVADSIAKLIAPRIAAKSFPEGFISDASHDLSFTFDRSNIAKITNDHFLGETELKIHHKDGKIIFQGTFGRSVSEAVIRALLWGRSTFSMSNKNAEMEKAVVDFLKWVSLIEDDIRKAISDSAFGTGFEENLKKEVYLRLGVEPLAGVVSLPDQIILS